MEVAASTSLIYLSPSSARPEPVATSLKKLVFHVREPRTLTGNASRLSFYTAFTFTRNNADLPASRGPFVPHMGRYKALELSGKIGFLVAACGTFVPRVLRFEIGHEERCLASAGRVPICNDTAALKAKFQ